MITILGAGPGGLALARILQQRGVDHVVLESDASASSRPQGGMLNINEDTGQRALMLAGLHEGFTRRVLEGGDGHTVRSRDGALLSAHRGDGTRPEIARGSLRELLLEALDPARVRWSTRVERVEREGAGFRLHCADGSTHHARLLVGADGAWSRVRPLLTDAAPLYTGVQFVEHRYQSVSERHPDLDAFFGDGSFFALDGERGILGHREPGDVISLYAAVKAPESWGREGPVGRALLARFADWHPTYTRALASSDTEPVVRPLYALPVGTRWERVPGVTLLGDAAHLMSPFAGEGVNLALADAADLAEALLARPDDTEAALAAYEASMFARSAEAAAESAKNLELAFDKEGCRAFIAFFQALEAAG